MAVKKLTELIPRESGVYQIRCKRNEKIYVGSAVDLRRRWDVHRRALRECVHHNYHLQHAWNLYGEVNFEFGILQFVPAADLLRAEQEWIERTDCTHRKIGFNISALASTQGEKTPPPRLDSPAREAAAAGSRIHWFCGARRCVHHHHQSSGFL